MEESLRGARCSSKDCLSSGRDSQEIVWFGVQYEQKKITCSSCFVMNDEAVKKCLPTAVNVMPVRYSLCLTQRVYKQVRSRGQGL